MAVKIEKPHSDRNRFLWAAAFYLLALAAQVSGFTNGWVALGLAAIATMIAAVPSWHHAHEWHEQRVTAGKLALEPWHLIAAGLIGVVVFVAIAIGGVIWQFSKPNVVVERSFGFAEALQPQKPQPLRKRLTSYDVEQRERAIDTILALLDPKLMQISKEGEILNHAIYDDIQNGTAIAALDQYAEKAKTAVDEYFQTTGRYMNFNDIYGASNDPNWNPTRIAEVSGLLRAELQEMQQRGQMQEARIYLRNNKFMTEWQQITGGGIWNWINQRKNALYAKRREYEQAEVYPTQ
jgi:hypothetical protein